MKEGVKTQNWQVYTNPAAKQIIGPHLNKLIYISLYIYYSISLKEQRPTIWGGGPVFKKGI